MTEKEFIWTDKRVAEACYWVGLRINGAEDLQRQIPPLIEKYKKQETSEQQKQYPEEEKIEFTHKGEKYYFLKSDMKKLNEFETSKFGASHRWRIMDGKTEEPLFQISGKDVFEGEEYWFVITNQKDSANYLPIKATGFADSVHVTEGRKYFLTNTEANEWIEENRPQYSKAELRSAFEESRLTHPMVGWKHDNFEDYLKWLSLQKQTP